LNSRETSRPAFTDRIPLKKQAGVNNTMDLPGLIAQLSDPTAYPEPSSAIAVCQTHISVVFLTDHFAYKVKKPVALGYLDFSTPAKRRHFCEEEVRLNRRLAPDVYLGVVPVTAAGLEAAGEPIDWAVKMRRLPQEATLEHHVSRGYLDRPTLEALARHLAAFHAGARQGPAVAAFGRLDVVARNVRENFEQASRTVGTAVHAAVLARLRHLTEKALNDLGPLIEARAHRGVPREIHGDLHLDHIYLFPERPPPGAFVIVDCIEFSECFRCADPVADAAFVVMDLQYHGRWDLARAFQRSYGEASQDAEGDTLFPFYAAYLAAVRAKVDGIKASESEVGADQRQEALDRARAHWLLALAELEAPEHRPCLILIAGLPGSGKSTLARALTQDGSRQLLQTDKIRKELASPLTGDAIYTASWNDRTYQECLRSAQDLLFQGQAVVVDGNFREDAQRQLLLEGGVCAGVPVVVLLCRADPEVARQRLLQRRHDISDADWAVFQRLAGQWQELGPFTRRYAVELEMNGSPAAMLEQARAAIEHFST
jgi:hypothetical protein